MSSPKGRRRVVIAAAVALFGLAPYGVGAQTCVGDCKGESRVDIGDLITGVNIVLGSLPVSACPAFQNGQGSVDVAQIIQGVNNALSGCSNVPTPTPGRFVDNGNGSVTDGDTGLVWEKKDQSGGLHDSGATYAWAGRCSNDDSYCQPSAAAADTCMMQTGGAVGCAQCEGAQTCVISSGLVTAWEWLSQLNAANFAGHNDWRLPTVAQDGGQPELDTIVDLEAPGCGSTAPCIAAAFDVGCSPGCTTLTCSCTQTRFYWSATSVADFPETAWEVYFYDGSLNLSPKTFSEYVRAVRGGR